MTRARALLIALLVLAVGTTVAVRSVIAPALLGPYWRLPAALRERVVVATWVGGRKVLGARPQR